MYDCDKENIGKHNMKIHGSGTFKLMALKHVHGLQKCMQAMMMTLFIFYADCHVNILKRAIIGPQAKLHLNVISLAVMMVVIQCMLAGWEKCPFN